VLTAAQQTLVEQNRDVVKMVVGKMRKGLPAHVDLEEMQSAGMAALCEAAIRYNNAVASFRTYATHCVRGGILDGFRSKAWGPRYVQQRKHIIPEATIEAALCADSAGPGYLASVADDGPSPCDQQHDREWAHHLMAVLPPRERQVIELLFFQGLKGGEVAQLLGVSHARVSAIKMTALERMRRAGSAA